MTLDEAIRHAEEVASKCEFDTDWGMGNLFIDRSGVADEIECGKEHRQLAEWLKDYKRLLEQTQGIKDAIAEIIEEKDFAYADFEQYKVDILGVDPEYVEDELPYDDFRYGMERCIEIIRKHIKVGDPE